MQTTFILHCQDREIFKETRAILARTLAVTFYRFERIFELMKQKVSHLSFAKFSQLYLMRKIMGLNDSIGWINLVKTVKVASHLYAERVRAFCIAKHRIK